MLRASQSPSAAIDAPLLGRKRQAESQDNERLSKRLSLLNLEHNGSKLYVPVETPSVVAQPSSQDALSLASSLSQRAARAGANDSMQLEDTKHKVYIYNIDEELAEDSDTEEGKLVFLPDIEKHLRENRIPPHILANQDGELAGMQLVLYSDPKSLSVPESKDSVRKAIIEARQRHRENQRSEGTAASPAATNMPSALGQTMEAEPVARGGNEGNDDDDDDDDDDVMEMD